MWHSRPCVTGSGIHGLPRRRRADRPQWTNRGDASRPGCFPAQPSGYFRGGRFPRKEFGMSTNAYLSFLAIGVVLVLLDGQVIYRSGRRYLENSYGDPTASASMTRLVTALFYIATLGILALISTFDLGGSDLPGVVGRIGVLLLVLALAHGITIGVLAHIRGEQQAEGVL